MKVLVACEESQRVCIAFREKGHEAYSCDIEPCSGGRPEWHIQQDVLPLLDGRCTFRTADGTEHAIAGRWDLIIAHPPCTFLSKAGACRMYKIINGKRYIDAERYDKMKSGKAFFCRFLDADCDRIAIENPLPLKICELPQPSQIIQPYEYGHPYSKKTLLWLKNLPPLMATEIVTDYTTFLPSNTSGYSKGRGGGRGAVRGQKNYSKTFEGIARAMAEQWGNLK